MKIYTKYISLIYIKYFFIVFIALEFFYVGIDLLANLKDLPSSANLKALYLLFNALAAINYTLPLSLIFALIISIFNIIRSNELISFYSLGISKNALIAPIFFISLFITTGFILLNNTPFVYAKSMQKNILTLNQLGKMSNDLFLKFDNKFIYIKELDPFSKSALNLEIFDFNSSNLLSKTSAKSGIYKDNLWILNGVEVINLPKIYKPLAKGLEKSKLKTIKSLKGFNPKTIDSIYNSGSYTIKQAFESIKMFKDQGLNLNSIKANLYTMIFSPLFAPFMILILYYYLPVTGRFFNLALLSFGFIVISLIVWGMLFILDRFSFNEIIYPEVGIIAPIAILMFYALYLVIKNR